MDTFSFKGALAIALILVEIIFPEVSSSFLSLLEHSSAKGDLGNFTGLIPCLG